jgi:Domain of unknown function (DUF4258)
MADEWATAFTAHAVKRMFERSLSREDVTEVLRSGVVIETYPDRWPLPARLVFGKAHGRPLHVVAADNDARNETIVVTVYDPERDIWDADLMRRLR